jgi:signal transduction histidine kinase
MDAGGSFPMLHEQYAELAELAGGFIHEIKNHLNTLSLNLQLLAEDFENPETQRERRALDRMTRLHGECRRLADLSNDFLRFARVEDLERTPIALDDVIGRMIDFFAPTAKEQKIEVIWYPAPDLPPLSLDRELFEKALQFGNAGHLQRPTAHADGQGFDRHGNSPPSPTIHSTGISSVRGARGHRAG